jgi:hypothetical protein
MTFNPESHEYRDGETVIRSVTQILADSGLIDTRWFTAEARERGSAVHKLCQRYANGERFDDISRPLESLEYVNALAQWFREKHIYAIKTEQIIEGVINGYRYAGTFDLLAEINGKRVLVDYKTGIGMNWHPAQIAAYAIGKIEGVSINPSKCIMLHLRPNGTYKENVIQGNALLSGLSKFKDAISFA